MLNDKRLCLEIKYDVKLAYILPFFISWVFLFIPFPPVLVIYLLLTVLLSLLSMFLCLLSFILTLFVPFLTLISLSSFVPPLSYFPPLFLFFSPLVWLISVFLYPFSFLSFSISFAHQPCFPSFFSNFSFFCAVQMYVTKLLSVKQYFVIGCELV